MKITRRLSRIARLRFSFRFERALLTWILILATAGVGRSQQQPTGAQTQNPPTPQADPNARPPVQSQPAASPKPVEQNPSPKPAEQNPSPKPDAPPATFAPPSAAQQPAQAAAPISLDDAVRMAITQASSFQQARLAEQIAAEDARQARLAFLPRVAGSFSHIYNSPAIGVIPREMSFISADAINHTEALAGITGDIDVAGRLRATLRRSVALLEAARAGTEVARRALAQGVNEAYYGLALAAARRRSAELTLSATEEFQRVTNLLLTAGEVAEVDLARARLQTATRRDELEQARIAESVAADSLRVLVGYDFTAPIATADLTMTPPDPAELARFTAQTISSRPEFAQFEAERRAAEEEVKIARADRLPQVSYSLNGGFDTDSLRPSPLKMHTGALASISVTIPIFDWGVSRSRERQAQLRAQTAQQERQLALRNFAQQFYTARAQAISAATRARLLQASVAEAERIVQTSIVRYRAGEAPILEVTDAQTALAAQRAALFQALFDYQISRARLAQAAGQ